MIMRLARTRIGGIVARWSLAHMSFLIPSEKLYETGVLVAFHHPRPSYPVHVLIVSRTGARGLNDLPDASFMRDLQESVTELVRRLDLEAPGYRLILNGGGYQDVDILHVHLVSGAPTG